MRFRSGELRRPGAGQTLRRQRASGACCAHGKAHLLAACGDLDGSAMNYLAGAAVMSATFSFALRVAPVTSVQGPTEVLHSHTS